MTVEIERVLLPEQAAVNITVSVSATVKVTDATAQRKVSKLLLDLVGAQLYEEQPSLVAGRRLLWRVPVWLGLPSCGPVGQVGTIDVDAQSGEILFSQQLLTEIAERGDAMARRALSA